MHLAETTEVWSAGSTVQMMDRPKAGLGWSLAAEDDVVIETSPHLQTDQGHVQTLRFGPVNVPCVAKLRT